MPRTSNRRTNTQKPSSTISRKLKGLAHEPPALEGEAQARFQEAPPAAMMAESAELRRPPGLGVWVLAARPRTLSAAVTPVLVGTAVAASQGSLRPLPALAALF